MNAVAAKLRELESCVGHGRAESRIVSLVDRLERKTGYRPEHTAAVGHLALKMAAALNLEAAECRRIELGALLHDVGKLSIPDRVMNKPGPLNEMEWAAMRRHTAAGVSLLMQILDLPNVLEVVRSHHERWDGQGYPDGLEGEQIPLAARIVAVADAFHAMTEPRPYREPREPAAALAEVVSQSGRQFDPACVRALQAVV
jgi:putative nucleotidyltransferase with HDIG domain